MSRIEAMQKLELLLALKLRFKQVGFWAKKKFGLITVWRACKESKNKVINKHNARYEHKFNTTTVKSQSGVHSPPPHPTNSFKFNTSSLM